MWLLPQVPLTSVCEKIEWEGKLINTPTTKWQAILMWWKQVSIDLFIVGLVTIYFYRLLGLKGGPHHHRSIKHRLIKSHKFTFTFVLFYSFCSINEGGRLRVDSSQSHQTAKSHIRPVSRRWTNFESEKYIIKGRAKDKNAGKVKAKKCLREKWKPVLVLGIVTWHKRSEG